MIYIHSPKDLNSKTIEVESVQIIRNVKGRLKVPVSQELLLDDFSSYLINKDDIDLIIKSSGMVMPAISKINELISGRNSVYELINLGRAVSMLGEMYEPILNNIKYLNEIESLQNQMIGNFSMILNNMPSAKTIDEKTRLNNELNLIFSRILRGNQIMFNSNGIINEGKFARINDLNKSLNEGCFFHFTVKEHLDKVGFNGIKSRIPQSELNKVDDIARDVIEIKKGVDKAYECNMNMVKLTIHIYSYLKVFLG